MKDKDEQSSLLRDETEPTETIGDPFLINGWKLYTPKDDPYIVIIEDSFETRKTMDVDDFVKLLDVLSSITDYE